MRLPRIVGSLRSRKKLRQMRNGRVVSRQFRHFLMKTLFADIVSPGSYNVVNFQMRHLALLDDMF